MFTTNELAKIAKKYEECIKGKELDIPDGLRRDFLELLASDEPIFRYKKLDSLRKKHSLKQLANLANPFFIGYGNPTPREKHKILFLGKEKAFDVNNLCLFLKESVNNILQWQKIDNILQRQKTEDDKIDLRKIDFSNCDKLDFPPHFPQQYFKKGIRSHAHTWAKYAIILDEILDKEKAYNSFTEHKKYEKSFFSKCFITEINYMPSPSSKGRESVEKMPFFKERQAFLKKSIIPKFDIIIIGAWAYFHKKGKIEEDKLNTLFGEVEKSAKDEHLKDEFKFLYYRVKHSGQHIFLTKQLSGLSKWDKNGKEIRWSKKRTTDFARRIKTSIK